MKKITIFLNKKTQYYHHTKGLFSMIILFLKILMFYYGMYINVETCMFSLADIKLVLTHSSTGMSIQHKSKAYNW